MNTLYKNLEDFLLHHKTIINQEVLNCYPESLEVYDQNMLNEMDSWKLSDFVKFESTHELSLLTGPKLKSLWSQAQRLCEIPELKINSIKLRPPVNRRVGQKKTHEIENILGIIEQILIAFPQTDQCFDFCSGMGKLSQGIANHFPLKKIASLDWDLQLQQKGQKIAAKNKFPQIEYIPLNLLENFPEITSPQNSLCIGLHGCGELTDRIIQLSCHSLPKNIILCGCCYSKTTIIDPHQFSYEALTLATKTHHPVEFDLANFKYQVKNYRYTFQLFLSEFFGLRKFFSIGNSEVLDYEKSFAHYALKNLERIKIDSVKMSDIESFYHRKDIQNKVLGLIKEKCTLDTKEVSYDDFFKN